MYRYLFLALILPLNIFADCSCDKHLYRAAIRHIEAGGIGYDDGYTTLEMFLSADPNQQKFTPFLDARAHLFNDGKWAANAGLGLRTLWGNRVYGVNAYYDYRTLNRFNANQIGIGIESLGECVDFRLNGYLPFGTTISSPYDATFETFAGNLLFLSQMYETTMKGANAEVGFHLGRSNAFDFYAAAGPYYFIGQVGTAAWGGKARISGTYNDMLTLEISDSYDRCFHNNFQAQLSISYSFGPTAKPCRQTNRMLQQVNRQEIIVVDNARGTAIAINPLTGEPFFFVFVDNTSSSDGTYESPYHTFAQAQENSSPNNIIYVFPGDGTTTGMDAGIALKNNQKLWGSGISHLIETTQGLIAIPALSVTSPTITNTDVDTDGNAVTLAANNSISGFTITSALNDGIYGTDPKNLNVSFCTFENNSTFAIEALFPGDATVSLTNNQLLNNANGINLFFEGTTDLICSNNTFIEQTSVSNAPIEIAASSNTLNAIIENNLFNNNTTGSIRANLDNVAKANFYVRNNTITNNGTGSQSNLASSFTILSNGTNANCSIELADNLFSGNASNALFLHTSGAFTNLELTASANTITNGGSGLVLATPTDNLTLLATDNIITGCGDNGIAVIATGTTTNGVVTISNNTITDIANSSNGIAVNQDFTTLDLNIANNEINRCEGSGIVSYAPNGIGSLTLDVSGNTISNCQNLSSNAASGLDIEQYTNLEGTIANNTLADNTGTAVMIGSTLTAPTACLTLTGNESTDYLLVNPGDGLFRLSPCDVNTVNTGTINTVGTIDSVQSCTNPIPCPP